MGVSETRQGKREAWSSENKVWGRRGMLLRGEGVVRLYRALWEIWGIIKGFGAGNIMILYVFSEDVTS